ncbi:uncharacterized protein LAESUDRAFT_724568 [Laetiporus sulphureus 93-53]|uniref:Uncharacterized protein n=1 Tax=Laetiporus sulphureus 93-53 TaxID=1314785 RepID=A0A165ERC4_9APHY|nr:uncharacterized protein LAESUDRAFT_724568 [Laetiporus sulphureus 93-53]KZT07603.1 hypothetical protein LAESUDRAFT_724568 [Laetiporus sulphureus 93-53]
MTRHRHFLTMDASRNESSFRPRMLWRNYNWDKRIARWESLPCLRLQPNRDLFNCQRCGFTNVLGFTCTWCSGLCDIVRVARSAVALVRRRASTPSLLSAAQKTRVDRMGRQRAHVVLSNRPERHLSPIEDSQIQLSANTVSQHSTKTLLRRNRRRAAIYSATDVVATSDLELQPYLRRLTDMFWTDEQPAAIAPSDCSSTRGASEVGLQAGNIESTESESVASTGTFSQRTLRRKQRMSVLRQRSSRSLRKRSSCTLSTASSRRGENPQAIVMQSASSSVAFAPVQVPLGHPHRPLYTAIRKNMASPSIPDVPIPAIDCTALHATPYDRTVKSLDIPRSTAVVRHYAFIPASDWTAGCSLTGEAELRMDLERCRSAEAIPIQYTEGEARRGRAVKEKVRNLRKGLKGLLTKRT